jgi:hypothetical protein
MPPARPRENAPPEVAGRADCAADCAERGGGRLGNAAALTLPKRAASATLILNS